MFTRVFHPKRFLRSVYGTDVFADYCRSRSIAFEQTTGAALTPDDARRWAAALAQLPHDYHAQVELELAAVNEMGGKDAIDHLLDVAAEDRLPPGSVPAGTPLSLWFLLHHPQLFRDVFFHHEIEEVDCWRTGSAVAGITLSELEGKAAGLADGLRDFFQARAGGRAFCTVEPHALPESVCFIAQVGDRLQFIDAFDDDGRAATKRLRPAQAVLFVYYPGDGTVLLKSRLWSRERTAGLLSVFGRTVLGSVVASDAPAFDLEPLKEPFHPLPDRDDMEAVRVKALHLRYPARSGRRQVKLVTLSSDAPDALDQLLSSHVEASDLPELRVSHAELQVRLRVAGQPKSYAIRLWPNRSNLSQTPLGDRFRVCLQRWGLVHARA